MSLNEKSKKELVDIAKQLKIKTNSKMDKKVLINLIEEHNKEHNKHSIEKEIQQKEILETILHPKEERITIQDLKDIQESRSEMKEQSADESLEELVINNNDSIKPINIEHKKDTTNVVNTNNKNAQNLKNDEFSYSEGYTGRKSSYDVL